MAGRTSHDRLGPTAPDYEQRAHIRHLREEDRMRRLAKVLLTGDVRKIQATIRELDREAYQDRCEAREDRWGQQPSHQLALSDWMPTVPGTRSKTVSWPVYHGGTKDYE